MYLSEITVRNIKCFRDLKLEFTEGDGEIRHWTTILGENGLGKSTLLQAMAVPLAGPGAMRELLPIAERWVRQEEPFGNIEAELLWHPGDAQLPKFPKKSPYKTHFLITGADPERLPKNLPEQPTVPSIVAAPAGGNPREREAITKAANRLNKTAYAENKQGWLACGYGPFRRLSGGSQGADKILYSGRKSARFLTLFREDAALTNAAEWLISLHNTARDGDESSRHTLDIVKQAFASDFLLEKATLLVDARTARLQLATKEPVPFESLSDGYRAMLALGIDLVRWLAGAFPDASDPLESHGVVLIDELDAHLHPRWQQRIGEWLLTKFPRIQFIIATHSPFLAQVSRPGGNIVLHEKNGEVLAEASQVSIASWRADQILTEIFGLESTRPPSIERDLRRMIALGDAKRSRALSSVEAKELTQFEIKFKDLPPALENPDERATAEELRRAVAKHHAEIGALE